MGKINLAEWENLRNFAADFKSEITKRYARSVYGNVGNFHISAESV